MQKLANTSSATTTTGKPVRKLGKASKPANAKPGKPVAAKPATGKPAKPAADVAETRAARLAKHADTVMQRGATNFDAVSSRDDAYLQFFAAFAKLSGDKRTVKLADVAKSGKCPNYDGSRKPTDGGALNRLIKAGSITRTDAATIRITDKAASLKLYSDAPAIERFPSFK